MSAIAGAAIDEVNSIRLDALRQDRIDPNELIADVRAVIDKNTSASSLQFIEDARAAGAIVDHITPQVNGSDWTVIGFKNVGEETFLVNGGGDVFVTRAPVPNVLAAVKANPATLPGIDLKPAGDIQIEVPAAGAKVEESKSENKIETTDRSPKYALGM
jgi:hypothetical protein